MAIILRNEFGSAALKILREGCPIYRIPLIGSQATLHCPLITLAVDNKHTLFLDDDVILLIEIVNQSHRIIDYLETKESKIKGK